MIFFSSKLNEKLFLIFVLDLIEQKTKKHTHTNKQSYREKNERKKKRMTQIEIQ